MLDESNGEQPRTLLITLTGKDRPGVTSMVFDTLARFGVEVMDIEQIVLRRRLILGLLVSSPRDWKPLRIEMERVATELGMTLELDRGSGDNRPRPEGRSHVTVLGTPLKAPAVAAIAGRIADTGANIDRIERMARYPITANDLHVADVGHVTKHAGGLAEQRRDHRLGGEVLRAANNDATLERVAAGDLVFGLRGTALFGVVLLAALPTAQNVFNYAQRYERGVILARDTVLITTIGAVPVLVLAADDHLGDRLHAVEPHGGVELAAGGLERRHALERQGADLRPGDRHAALVDVDPPGPGPVV